MKMKLIFLLFNVVLIISFIIILFMPVFLVGFEYALTFWAGTYPIVIIFVILLTVFDIYFVIKLPLFEFLEKEDWQGLVEYLSNKIYNKKSFTAADIRLYVNALFVTGDISGIGKLRQFLEANAQKYATRFALILGIEYIAATDYENAIDYFEQFDGKKRVENRDWLVWVHGFVCMVKNNRDCGKQKLLAALDITNNTLIKGLCVYLLQPYSSDEEIRETLQRTKREIYKKAPSIETWKKMIAKAKSKHILPILVSRLIDEATEYLYKSNVQ